MCNDHKVKLLHIILPKTSTCVKSYDGQSKWMLFFIEDDSLLEKYNTIWDKVSADLKKSLIAILRNYFLKKAMWKMYFLKQQF